MSFNAVVYVGHISRYNKKMGFRFIKTPNQESFYFIRDYRNEIQRKRNGEILRIHKFSSGDEVEFKLKESSRKGKEYEAYDVTFIQNIRSQKLVLGLDVETSAMCYYQQ